jgi:thiol-disulfide isomerase/thioredoxin
MFKSNFKINFTCFLSLFFLIGCKKSQDDAFQINGSIKNGYIGYIYLNYNNLKDSCLIKNNSFYFKGKVNVVDIAYFSTKNKPSFMEKDFYLENKNITINISIDNVKMNNLNLDKIKINNLFGTKTTLIEKEYEDFKKMHENDKDWVKKQYAIVNKIITKYPKHRYSGDLLARVSWDSLSNITELQKMYQKLDLKHQNPQIISVLKTNLFPTDNLMEGKGVIDFILPNKENISFNSKILKGKYYLIDFWASWCSPCRKSFVKLKKIYGLYKTKNFEIIGISIDKNLNKWKEALVKDELSWINLIENKDFFGPVAKKYNIQSIPTNYLISPEGIIVAKDISAEDLEKFLQGNLK